MDAVIDILRSEIRILQREDACDYEACDGVHHATGTSRDLCLAHLFKAKARDYAAGSIGILSWDTLHRFGF